MRSPIVRHSLGDQVYLQILQRIECGELATGSKLRDTTIASELGVSRTPVREALVRLTREGVLSAEPGRGFRLTPLAPAELRDIGSILAALEPLALDQSPEPDPDQLSRLAEVVRRLEQTRGDIPACVELDEQFHRVLLEGCSNRRLVVLLETLRRGLRRYLYHYLQRGGRVSLSTLQHTRIAEALRKGDRATARQLLERKWRRGMEEIEATLR
ncbi:MAG TPA: GntR family transcriptional regulator [Gemmatimonadales bacterium]|nr:GntR family transcriptional regulator [Gemmatimonadales bacterium]